MRTLKKHLHPATMGCKRHPFPVLLAGCVICWFAFSILGPCSCYAEILLDASWYYARYPDDRSRGLQEAVDQIAANGGGTLYFPPGLYRINRTLVLKGKICIVGASRSASIIEADPSEATTIIGCPVIDRYPGPGTLLFETRSVTAVSRGSFDIEVADPEKFTPGQTIAMVSENELWPYEPRDYVHPGELNEVVAVTGNTVMFKYPFYDAYPSDLLMRGYDLWPIEVRNLTLRFTYIAEGTKCLTLANALGPVVENMGFANSGYAAIWAVLCNRGSLSHNYIENVASSQSDTGYGIHTYGCLGLRIAYNTITSARRGIDLSGTIPSRRIVVEKNVVSVSTDRSLGASGMGTHGPAEDCVFRNNTIKGGLISFVLRGRNIDLEDNATEGFRDHGVCSTAGCGHFVRDNRFESRSGYSGMHLSPGVASDGMFCYLGNQVAARNGFSANSSTDSLVFARNTIRTSEALALIGSGVLVRPILWRDNAVDGPKSVYGKLLPDAGIFLEDGASEITGTWYPSTSVLGYLGTRYLHDGNSGKGQKSVRFAAAVTWTGTYTVEISFPAYRNRARAVPVVVHHADGESTVYVDQTKQPSKDSFFKLGAFPLFER